MDDLFAGIDEALRAGEEAQLDAALEYAREKWHEVRERGGDPAVIVIAVDKNELGVAYTTTAIKPTEVYYYLHQMAHDFITGEIADLDEAE